MDQELDNESDFVLRDERVIVEVTDFWKSLVIYQSVIFGLNGKKKY